MTVGVFSAKKLQSWRHIANVRSSPSLSGFFDCVWEKSQRALSWRYVFIIVRYLNERRRVRHLHNCGGFSLSLKVELLFSNVHVTRLADEALKIKTTCPKSGSNRSENCEKSKKIRKIMIRDRLHELRPAVSWVEKLREIRNHGVSNFSTRSSNLSSRWKRIANETMNCTGF